MASSKKGISARQLHRTLEVTYKSAWFLAHRIHEAMRQGKLSPLGDRGKTVEIDETYIGRLEGMAKSKKVVLLTRSVAASKLSCRCDYTQRSHKASFVRTLMRKESIVTTDEGRWYQQLGGHFF